MHTEVGCTYHSARETGCSGTLRSTREEQQLWSFPWQHVLLGPLTHAAESRATSGSTHSLVRNGQNAPLFLTAVSKIE